MKSDNTFVRKVHYSPVHFVPKEELVSILFDCRRRLRDGFKGCRNDIPRAGAEKETSDQYNLRARTWTHDLESFIRCMEGYLWHKTAS